MRQWEQSGALPINEAPATVQDRLTTRGFQGSWARSIGFGWMRSIARCVGRPWGRSHGRKRASLYQAVPALSVLRNGDKGQDAPRNPRFQPSKLKSPFRGASVQAEGADRPLRGILASGTGRGKRGEGGKWALGEPDSTLRGIIGGGGFSMARDAECN